MKEPKTVEEVSPLFSDEHLREFFLRGIFEQMARLGFCGLSLNNDGSLDLYKKRVSFYEPFNISEFREGTETKNLFLTIYSIFKHFNVTNPMYMGYDGFSQEAVEGAAADA